MNGETAAGAADFAILAALNIGTLFSAVLVLLMQPGFMLLEAGSVSRKNVLSNIFKNVVDMCVGGVVFYFVGYSILIGQGPIVEQLTQLGLARTPPPGPPKLSPAEPIYFLFQFGFASAAVTISSGAVTGRVSPYAYMVFALIFTGLIYPVVGLTVWSESGLLYGVFTDFAGSVVVHATGAAAGLAGAILLGPRLGYNGYDPIDLGQDTLFRIAATHQPHNMPLAALGVLALWLGWFGFNGGTLFAGGAPVGALGEDHLLRIDALMGHFGAICVNTALAPCAAVTTLIVLQTLRREDLDMPDILNSAIAGLVAITAGADALSPEMAMVAGVAAAFVFRWTKAMMIRFSIDDPVAAVSAHGLTGVLGVTCVSLGAETDMLSVAGFQAACGLAIFACVFAASIIAFILSEWLCKIAMVLFGRMSFGELFRERYLRIDYETEIHGLDGALHGQDAYNFRSMR